MIILVESLYRRSLISFQCFGFYNWWTRFHRNDFILLWLYFWSNSAHPWQYKRSTTTLSEWTDVSVNVSQPWDRASIVSRVDWVELSFSTTGGRDHCRSQLEWSAVSEELTPWSGADRRTLRCRRVASPTAVLRRAAAWSPRGRTGRHPPFHAAVVAVCTWYLILDEVGLCRRMSFNCPTRYIDPAGFWTY